MRRACSYAAALARQLQAFSRREVAEPPVVNLFEAIEQTMRMLRPAMGAGIDVVLPRGCAVGQVRIDRGALVQIVTNLALNACDAMPDGGMLKLATSDVVLDAARGNRGAYVRLAVEDEGVGMDGETCALAFEPFFTTKGPGRGTGLGLATVRGLVQQAGGFIEVRSEPGRGTTFDVYLPRVFAETGRAAELDQRP
jgi:signal transduction histidine kinase